MLLPCSEFVFSQSVWIECEVSLSWSRGPESLETCGWRDVNGNLDALCCLILWWYLSCFVFINFRFLRIRPFFVLEQLSVERQRFLCLFKNENFSKLMLFNLSVGEVTSRAVKRTSSLLLNFLLLWNPLLRYCFNDRFMSDLCEPWSPNVKHFEATITPCSDKKCNWVADNEPTPKWISFNCSRSVLAANKGFPVTYKSSFIQNQRLQDYHFTNYATKSPTIDSIVIHSALNEQLWCSVPACWNIICEVNVAIAQAPCEPKVA